MLYIYTSEPLPHAVSQVNTIPPRTRLATGRRPYISVFMCRYLGSRVSTDPIARFDQAMMLDVAQLVPDQWFFAQYLWEFVARAV